MIQYILAGRHEHPTAREDSSDLKMVRL
jgi:hypothetical protein